jgi:hypothetical protein
MVFVAFFLFAFSRGRNWRIFICEYFLERKRKCKMTAVLLCISLNFVNAFEDVDNYSWDTDCKKPGITQTLTSVGT